MLKFSKLVLTGITGVAGGIYIDRNVLPLHQTNKTEPESSRTIRLSKVSIEVGNFFVNFYINIYQLL